MISDAVSLEVPLEMTDNPRKRPQITLLTLLLLMAAFSVGFVTRNLVDGIHPFYVGLSIPASNSPVRAGEILRIECMVDETINRDAVVLSDSTINLPLVGIVDVRDKTTTQIEQILNKKYSKFLATPQIQVFRSATSQTR